MEVGKRYIFVGTDNKTYTGDLVSVSDTTIHTDNNAYEGTFMNISGRHDTVHLKTQDNGINSFSIYCVKYIDHI